MISRKKLLFVDDEPLVLQGLKRALRSMSGDWEMEFVGSGEEALVFLAATPFDVVVSDMRMPGMTGAELLNRVAELYPKTVRLILSGHADRDLTARCVGSTHQYLSKPCEPDDIRSAVSRAAWLEKVLQSECLQLLFRQIKYLPTVPSLYLDLVETLKRSDASLEDVGRVIGKDPVTTAKILRICNSVMFGSGHAIDSPEAATVYLGLDATRALVLSLGAFSQFEQARLGGMTVDALWRHSRSVATLAKQIARLQTEDLKVIDEAFVAGMLHDLGKLVMAARLPDEYAEVARLASADRLELWAAEEQVLGANHGEAGGYLLGLWGLSVPIVEAITFHHRPSHGSHPEFTPLTAVHAADVLVHEANPNDSRFIPARLDLEYLESLRLTDRLSLWRQAAAAVNP
jgi:HD-like signal output (HDOD) protein